MEIDAGDDIPWRRERLRVPAEVEIVAGDPMRPTVDDVDERPFPPWVEAGWENEEHLHAIAVRTGELDLAHLPKGDLAHQSIIELRELSESAPIEPARSRLGGRGQRLRGEVHPPVAPDAQPRDRAGLEHELRSPTGLSQRVQHDASAVLRREDQAAVGRMLPRGRRPVPVLG